MIFVTGGAWQGKREFVQKQFGLKDNEIFACSGTLIDYSYPCIEHLERFTYACVCEGLDPVSNFEKNIEKWSESVLICEDISCGVVPVGAELRAWRNENGKLCQYLAGKAEHVSRIFCGLELKLK